MVLGVLAEIAKRGGLFYLLGELMGEFVFEEADFVKQLLFNMLRYGAGLFRHAANPEDKG